LKTPKFLEESDNFTNTEKIRVHSGFKSKSLIVERRFWQTPFRTNENSPILFSSFLSGCLFDDKVDASGENSKDKYGQILKSLDDVYNYEENGVKVHAGFKLYVTGHR